MKFILLAAVVALGFAWWLWPTIAASIAPIVASNEEINACAIEAAISDYRREYDWKNKTWIKDVRSREDAIQAVIVDMGEQPDIFRQSASYKWTGLRTVFDGYLDEGRRMCIQRKMRGETISMPDLKVKDGYHVMRWMGSASLVKDGDPEPVFGKTLPNGTTIWSDGKQH